MKLFPKVGETWWNGHGGGAEVTERTEGSVHLVHYRQLNRKGEPTGSCGSDDVSSFMRRYPKPERPVDPRDKRIVALAKALRELLESPGDPNVRKNAREALYAPIETPPKKSRRR